MRVRLLAGGGVEKGKRPGGRIAPGLLQRSWFVPELSGHVKQKAVVPHFHLMRHHRPLISASFPFLLLALVITGDVLVMTGRLHPGARLLPTHSYLSALFQAWR